MTDGGKAGLAAVLMGCLAVLVLAAATPAWPQTTTTQPPSTLTLTPNTGETGTVVKVRGENHPVCSSGMDAPARGTALGTPRPGVVVAGRDRLAQARQPDVQIRWDGSKVLAEFSRAETFDQKFVVPDSAPGRHRVESYCTWSDEVMASAVFEVTVPPPLTLNLRPVRGESGSKVIAQGTGHTCDTPEGSRLRSPVTLLWDDGTELGSIPPSDKGSFSLIFTVPKAALGGHTVVSRCLIRGKDQGAKAGFEVTQSVTTTTTRTPNRAPDPARGPAGGVTPGGTDPTPTTTGGVTTPRIEGVTPGGTDPTPTPTTDTTRRRGGAPPPGATTSTAQEPAIGTTPETAGPEPLRGSDLRSVFPASVAAPGEVSLDLKTIALHAGLALLLILLVAFPADLFNKTVEENYDRIRGWFHRLPGSSRSPGWWSSTLGFVVFALAGALLYSLIDPGFRPDPSKLVPLITGLLVAIVVTTLAFEIPIALYARKACHERSTFRIYPGALLIGVVCVAASRLAHFHPGYAYGVIGGYTLMRGRELSRQDEGRSVSIASLVVLAVSLVAWVAWMPFNAAAKPPGATLPVLIGDAVLGTTFVMGLEGLVFGLVPLTFMDGSKLARWRRPVWLGLYGVVVLAFVHTVLDPRAEYVKRSSQGSLMGVLVLFFAFGAGSVLFWAYFRYLNRSEQPLGAAN